MQVFIPSPIQLASVKKSFIITTIYCLLHCYSYSCSRYQEDILINRGRIHPIVQTPKHFLINDS